MTEVEARKVFDIFAEVDGGCSVCVVAAFSDFIRAFPEMEKPAWRYWSEKDLAGVYPFHLEKFPKASGGKDK